MSAVMSERSGKINHLSISNKMVLRAPENFWLWSPEQGYDLTRPADPNSEPKASNLRLECQVSDVTIDQKSPHHSLSTFKILR